MASDGVRVVSTAEESVAAVVRWFDSAQRDLPWRAADRTAWGVLVSEFMLQQTPVARVLPVWQEWLARWPAPAALAAEPAGAAVRAWGRLGYPRRALRLHASARQIVEKHAGQVPEQAADLLALPGVGEYTANAVLAFAFGRRAVVLDTNVRRVLARAFDGVPVAAAHQTQRERLAADSIWPAADDLASHWSAAAMELGALVCLPSPRCNDCPLAESCAWVRAGRPDTATGGPRSPARRQPTFADTDRAARGALLATVRAQADPLPAIALADAWGQQAQRDRALTSLVTDGLLVQLPDGRYALPGEHRA